MDSTVTPLVDPRRTTVDELIRLAEEGAFSKDVLAELLDIGARRQFLKACADIERGYTERCQAAKDPCLDDGCAMDEGEVCLEPIERAGVEYRQACAAAWVAVFRDARNRIAAWRH